MHAETHPDIAASVGDRIEVLLDSSVRRGGDIAKCLSLGATACLLGRPQAFALAAAGENGLVALLSHIEVELEATLALLGGAHCEKPDGSHCHELGVDAESARVGISGEA